MNAADLRRDLSKIRELGDLGAYPLVRRLAEVCETIALPILEGDEELEEGLAIIIDEVAFRREADWGERLEARQKARKILRTLAALMPTDEDSK